MVLGMNEFRSFIPKNPNKISALDKQQDIRAAQNIELANLDKRTWYVHRPNGDTETIKAHICSPYNDDGSLLLQDYCEDGDRIITHAYHIYQWEAVTWGTQGLGFKNTHLSELIHGFREKALEERRKREAKAWVDPFEQETN